MSGDRSGEASEAIRARVEPARAKQQKRFAGTNGKLQVNADMGPAQMRKYCELAEGGKQLIRAAMTTHHHATL